MMHTQIPKVQKNNAALFHDELATFPKLISKPLQRTVKGGHSAHIQNKLMNSALTGKNALKISQLQKSADTFSSSKINTKSENKTGLPDKLRTGIEKVSGYSMHDVKVHYNSDKPAQLFAHAYAQGTDIHLGPGQEKHLPHEAWHVVQQKQGRVKPTTQFNGAMINDNSGLEKEADNLGMQSLKSSNSTLESPKQLKKVYPGQNSVLQGFFIVGPNRISGDMNIVWEDKKDVYATPEKFGESNHVLSQKNGKYLLHAGAHKNYGGNTNFYKVEPRLNPATNSPKEQELQPTMGDNNESLLQKHQAYIVRLNEVEFDLDNFRKTFPIAIQENPNWHKFENRKNIIGIELNKWCHVNQFRFDLLFMALAEATLGYLDHGNINVMIRDIMEVQAKFRAFVLREEQYPRAISLPNDCAQCVSTVIGGAEARERGNPDPEIGGNYHEVLQGPHHNPLGWNFHWAGVIMKDGGDNITLESAAGMSFVNADRQTWWFGMYGTAKNEQTFKHQIQDFHYRRNIELLTRELPNGIENYRFNDHFGIILDIVQMRKALREMNGK